MLGGGGSWCAAGVPGCSCGGRGASGSLACTCSFVFGRGLVDEVSGAPRKQSRPACNFLACQSI